MGFARCFVCQGPTGKLGLSLSGRSAHQSLLSPGQAGALPLGSVPQDGIPGAGGGSWYPGYACAYEMGIILAVLKKAG